MARAEPLTVTVETDFAMDALGDLMRLHLALRSRHGERFRTLERDIERLTGRGLNAPIESAAAEALIRFETLLSDAGEGGRFVAVPGATLLDLLKRGRDLGVEVAP